MRNYVYALTTMPLRKQVSIKGSIVLPMLLLNMGVSYFNSDSQGSESALASSTSTSLVSTSLTSISPTSQISDLQRTDTAISSETITADLNLFAPLAESEDLAQAAAATALWNQKEVRGIYISRYQITNRASEATIRGRVRYYKQQGINTIIHGVWGNGCTMYPSDVMMKTFGIRSCPNEFQDQWLDWMIDEAHQQGMEVHAYFEKGIKLDRNSPIFDRAVANNWFVPGIDRTYASVEHHVLDVQNPAISQFFEQIMMEFVRRYPTVDAVQWDDYVGYHAALPGGVDRTASLTNFVLRMRNSMKSVNPNVSFDICHHNPYWGARYFAADWENWGADRAFIQAYNDANFYDEVGYVENYEGIAISDNQLHRLEHIINNPNIRSVLIFPTSGDPEMAARRVNATITGR